MRRSGAAPGDVLALAGAAGRSATGLALLLRADADPDGEPPLGSVPDRLRALGPAAAAVVDQHLAPVAPVLAGAAAREAGASAMLDVSDGLALDAARLARASGVTVDLDPSAFADDVAASRDALRLAAPELGAGELDAWALDLVLGGGEDHSLLASFPPGTELPAPFHAVGRVTGTVEDRRTPAERAAGFVPDADGARVTVGGEPRVLGGWDPYTAPGARTRGDG